MLPLGALGSRNCRSNCYCSDSRLRRDNSVEAEERRARCTTRFRQHTQAPPCTVWAQKTFWRHWIFHCHRANPTMCRYPLHSVRRVGCYVVQCRHNDCFTPALCKGGGAAICVDLTTRVNLSPREMCAPASHKSLYQFPRSPLTAHGPLLLYCYTATWYIPSGALSRATVAEAPLIYAVVAKARKDGRGCGLNWKRFGEGFTTPRAFCKKWTTLCRPEAGTLRREIEDHHAYLAPQHVCAKTDAITRSHQRTDRSRSSSCSSSRSI